MAAPSFQGSLPVSLQMTIATGTQEVSNAKLHGFCRIHEIPSDIEQKLAKLSEWDIVFVCDDSGSMNTNLKGKRKTRWDELRETTALQIELATCIDKDGPDIYFLNRHKIKNVTGLAQVTAAFDEDPCGGTPLCGVVRKILKEKYNGENKLLIIIATDGVPSDPDTATFRELVESRGAAHAQDKEIRQGNIRFGFIACTDNSDDVAYLDDMDNEIPGVDVTDDYESERKQVKDKDSFSRGMWVAKALAGPVFKEFDKKDE